MDEKQKVTLNMEKFKKKIQEAVSTITTKEAKQMLDELSQALTPYLIVLENEDLIREELKKRGFTEDMYTLADSDDPEEQQIFMDAFHAVVEAADRKQIEKKNNSDIKKSFQLGVPKKYTSPNTRLSNFLKDNTFTGTKETPIGLPVLNVGKPNETMIAVSATLENLKAFPITGKPFTEFDRAVHDAVASLYEDRIKNGAEPVFTADVIYRTMTHKAASERVSPQQRASVTKSVNKMRKNIYIIADCTEEFKKRKTIVNPEGKTDEEKYHYILDDWLLSAKHVEKMAVGGKLVDGYIFSEPLLLNYAKLTKQLITVEGKILRIQELNEKGCLTENTISDTDNRIAVKSYLIRRIEVMRHDEKDAIDALKKYNNKRMKDKDLPEKKLSEFHKQERTIVFDSLFKDTGIENANRKTEARQYVYQVLDYWKAIEHIKSYKLRKKGKSIDAILIDI